VDLDTARPRMPILAGQQVEDHRLSLIVDPSRWPIQLNWFEHASSVPRYSHPAKTWTWNSLSNGRHSISISIPNIVVPNPSEQKTRRPSPLACAFQERI